MGFFVMMKNVLKVAAAVLVLGTAAGCTNTELLNEVRAKADAAAADAASAKTAAEAARAADRASQQAASAASTANQALSAANSAQSCCDANTERLERMFQRSMSK